MNPLARFTFYARLSSTQRDVLNLLIGLFAFGLLATAGYFVLQLFPSPMAESLSISAVL